MTTRSRVALAALVLVLTPMVAWIPPFAGASQTACPAPTNARVTGVEGNAVTVAWDAVPGADSYEVYSQAFDWTSADPNVTDIVRHLSVTGTQATTRILGASTWLFAVGSVCAGSPSHARSNVVTAWVGMVVEPASVCAIDPASTETAITAAINSCPDGTAAAYTVVKFPANASYTVARRVEVKDRQYLNIDLNGSRITTTSNGTVTQAIDPVILVLRGRHIQIRNGTLVGEFTDYEGQQRSLATIGIGDPEFTEGQMGVGLYGTDSVTLEDLKLFNHWGDGVTLGRSEYVDGSAGPETSNVWMRRLEVETVGRHCFAPTAGNNVWIEDSQCRDAWYGGIDAEADAVAQPLRGHHYLRNTFDGFNHFGILIPVITTDSGDWEIRDNTFLTPNDVPSYPVIQVGIYPTITNRAQNVNITGNKVKFYCQAITLDNTDGGSISDNTLTRAYKPLPDGSGNYTPEGICGAGNTDPITVTDSTNVTVADNAVT